jgi:UDP:flavonoid glycosyltransferase YjiC (YdhE family)
MVALALELQRRGHVPVIATSEYYGEKITSGGVAFHAIRPNLTPDDKSLLRAVMDERGGPEHVIRRLMVPAVCEMYADLMEAVRGADLLLSAELVFAADSVAEMARIPWVVVTLAPLSFMSRHDPPILIQVPWLTRIAGFSKPLYASLVRLSQWGIRHWTEPVRQMRRDLGLDPGPAGIFGPRAEASAILAMFSPLVGAPQPDWPVNARVTGFAFYDRHEPMPPALQTFLDAGEPPIVFTLGSAAVFDPGEFYRASAAAARAIGRRAVLLVGPDAPSAPSSDHQIAVAPYAPFSELFPRAATIVHQAGIGTTAQALRAGKPMLIVPFSHDQPDNGARMVRLGVAKVLGRRQYSAAAAAEALRGLLENPAYRERAAAAAAQIQRENGAATGADVIEKVLREEYQHSRTTNTLTGGPGAQENSG